jgi:hypothetical protein
MQASQCMGHCSLRSPGAFLRSGSRFPGQAFLPSHFADTVRSRLAGMAQAFYGTVRNWRSNGTVTILYGWLFARLGPAGFSYAPQRFPSSGACTWCFHKISGARRAGRPDRNQSAYVSFAGLANKV